MTYRLAGILSLGFWGVTAAAVEIPVSRGEAENTRVGFVDMERIYQEYPETQKARAEFRKEVARHKNAIAERERELEDLERQITALKEAPAIAPMAPVAEEVPAVSTGAASGAGETPDDKTFANLFSTGAASSVQEGLAVREAQLIERRAGLEKHRADAVQSLRDFEAKQSKQILGRLYRALVQVADEQGISLVVDKSAILYGQNAIDLTEALGRRVRGLPENSQ